MRQYKHIWVGGGATVLMGLAAGVLSLQAADADASPVYISTLASQLASDFSTGARVDAASDMVRWAGAQRTASKNTARQQQCLSEAIYYEARSETLAGQKAVAEVILNRVASKHFPNTICGVVYQGAQRRTGCQFSFTCDGSLNKMPHGRHWTRAQNVASLAMTKGATPATKRATHYHTQKVNPPWAKTLVKTGVVDSHIFYRFKNRREVRESSAVSMNVAPPS